VETSDMNYIATVTVGIMCFGPFRMDISLICIVPDKNNSNVRLL
jgi:hypothetical protein